MKEYGNTAKVSRHRPPKLPSQTGRQLVRDAAKRPMGILDEMQRSTGQAEDSVHRTTIGLVGDTANMWKKLLSSGETQK